MLPHHKVGCGSKWKQCLIKGVNRAQVKALVRNAQATRNAFGSYVEAVEASIGTPCAPC